MFTEKAFHRLINRNFKKVLIIIFSALVFNENDNQKVVTVCHY